MKLLKDVFPYIKVDFQEQMRLFLKFFISCTGTFFWGTNASNQHAGQQPGSLMGPSCCVSEIY